MDEVPFRPLAVPVTNDYDRVAAAIAFISSRVREQPSLDEVAAHVHLSPFHFQRLFSRWAGISPKRFLESLTLAHAKDRLRTSRSLLEVSLDVGLSGSSRLHDHFVQLDAVTPGEYTSGGAGLRIEVGVHPTPFGAVFLARTGRGICELAFCEGENPDLPLAHLRARWPNADIRADGGATSRFVDTLFHRAPADRPLSLHVRGTNFQIRVWNALLNIPPGYLASYRQIAEALGVPGGARAVGGAVGANPVAFLIPCHRVIREDGTLGGYRWGETRKRALLAWESAERDGGSAVAAGAAEAPPDD